MWEKRNQADVESLFAAAEMRAVTSAVASRAAGTAAAEQAGDDAARAIERLRSRSSRALRTPAGCFRTTT